MNRWRTRIYLRMLIVTLLTEALLLGAINLLNYRAIIEEARDQIACMMDESSGNLHKINDREYCIVSLHTEIGDTTIDACTTPTMPTGELEQYIQSLYVAERYEGRDEYFYFMADRQGDIVIYYLLNIKADLYQQKHFLENSVILGVLLFLILSIPLGILADYLYHIFDDYYREGTENLTNLSHSLRTPLAILKADIDVLELEQGDNQWLDSMRNQVSRMSNLTETLILLSRLQEQSITFDKETLNVTEYILSIAQEMEPLADSYHHQIICLTSEPVMISCNRRMLYQLLSILYDNAIQYAAPNADILVGVTRIDHRIVLEMTNRVVDLEAGNYDNLFRRFYHRGHREDVNREHGIGLAAANEIVKGLGGEIHADCPDGRNMIMKVILFDEK